jgi:hypothetical protein
MICLSFFSYAYKPPALAPWSCYFLTKFSILISIIQARAWNTNMKLQVREFTSLSHSAIVAMGAMHDHAKNAADAPPLDTRHNLGLPPAADVVPLAHSVAAAAAAAKVSAAITLAANEPATSSVSVGDVSETAPTHFLEWTWRPRPRLKSPADHVSPQLKLRWERAMWWHGAPEATRRQAHTTMNAWIMANINTLLPPSADSTAWATAMCIDSAAALATVLPPWWADDVWWLAAADMSRMSNSSWSRPQLNMLELQQRITSGQDVTVARIQQALMATLPSRGHMAIDPGIMALTAAQPPTSLASIPSTAQAVPGGSKKRPAPEETLAAPDEPEGGTTSRPKLNTGSSVSKPATIVESSAADVHHLPGPVSPEAAAAMSGSTEPPNANITSSSETGVPPTSSSSVAPVAALTAPGATAGSMLAPGALSRKRSAEPEATVASPPLSFGGTADQVEYIPEPIIQRLRQMHVARFNKARRAPRLDHVDTNFDRTKFEWSPLGSRAAQILDDAGIDWRSWGVALGSDNVQIKFSRDTTQWTQMLTRRWQANAAVPTQANADRRAAAAVAAVASESAPTLLAHMRVVAIDPGVRTFLMIYLLHPNCQVCRGVHSSVPTH